MNAPAVYPAELEADVALRNPRTLVTSVTLEETIHENHSDRSPRRGVRRAAHVPVAQGLLTALNAQGERCNLAVDSALAHPELPMLLAWSPAEVPDFGTLRGIRSLAPTVHAAAHEPAALLRQIHNLLASPPQPTVFLAPTPATAR